MVAGFWGPPLADLYMLGLSVSSRRTWYCGLMNNTSTHRDDSLQFGYRTLILQPMKPVSSRLVINEVGPTQGQPGSLAAAAARLSFE